MGEDDFSDSKKPHVKRKSGKKHDKKNAKDGKQDASSKQVNPKAFAIQNATKTERRVRRKQDITEKKTHQPLVDR